MVGWHHELNGPEFEQIPGDSEGQGILVCCSPWGCKELDTTEQLNNNLRTGVWFGQAFSVFVWAFLIAVMAVATCHGAGGCAIYHMLMYYNELNVY